MADISDLLAYIISLFSLIFIHISLIVHLLVAYIPGLWNYILSSYPLVLLSFTAFFSLIYAIYGKLRYGISFFQPLEELAHRQANYRRERDLIESNIKLASYFVELGDSLLDVIQLEAAKDAYKKALSFDPKNIDANIGILKSEVFQPILTKEPAYYDMEKTRKKLELILSINTHDRHALYFLGEIYRNVKNEEAKNFYNQVLSLYSRYYVSVGETRSDNYCTILNKIKVQIRALLTKSKQGVIIKLCHQPRTSQSLLSEHKSDLCSFAYYGLYGIALKEKKKDSAFKYVSDAYEICNFNPVILNGLGYMHLVRREYEDTIRILAPLLESNPYTLASYCNIIQAYRMTGNIRNAYVYSKKLIHCMENEDVFSLITNRRMNIVEIDRSGEGVLLKGVDNRKFYGYCTVALTCYLNGLDKEASTYMHMALNLNFCDKILYSKIMLYQIECMQEEYKKQEKYKELISKLENFRKMVENLDSCKPELNPTLEAIQIIKI